jgi:hypothetical protein
VRIVAERPRPVGPADENCPQLRMVRIQERAA